MFLHSFLRTLALFLLFVLTGCQQQGTTPSAQELASKQSAQLTSYLPVQNQGYTLVSSRSTGPNIVLIFIANQRQNSTIFPPQQFLAQYQMNLCVDNYVRQLLHQGVRYQVHVNSGTQTPDINRIIDAQSCAINTQK